MILIYNFQSTYYDEISILSIKLNGRLIFEIRLFNRHDNLIFFFWENNQQISVLTSIKLNNGLNIFEIIEKDKEIVLKINDEIESIEKTSDDIEIILSETEENKWDIQYDPGRAINFKQNQRRN